MLGVSKGIIGVCLVGAVVFTGVRVNASEQLFGVTSDTHLITFDSAAPGILTSSRVISGLKPNESIVGLSWSGGTLYGLGSLSDLYSINSASGAATAIGGTFSTLLNGNYFGTAIRPNTSAFQITSDLGQNLSVNLTTGVATAGPSLVYPTGDSGAGQVPQVTGLAWNGPNLTFYGVDYVRNVLVTEQPSTGNLTSLPNGATVDVQALNGMTISPFTGTLFLATAPSNTGAGSTSANLYTADKTTGIMTLVGTIGGLNQNIIIEGLAAVPEPSTWVLAGFGLTALAVFRRRK
jgi:hypothetical protein